MLMHMFMLSLGCQCVCCVCVCLCVCVLCGKHTCSVVQTVSVEEQLLPLPLQGLGGCARQGGVHMGGCACEVGVHTRGVHMR